MYASRAVFDVPTERPLGMGLCAGKGVCEQSLNSGLANCAGLADRIIYLSIT